MDIMTVFYVVVYFTIGWFLADWMNTEDKDEVATFIFLFWPLLIIMLVGMLVLAVAMLVTVLLSKLISLCDLKRGGDSDVSV